MKKKVLAGVMLVLTTMLCACGSDVPVNDNTSEETNIETEANDNDENETEAENAEVEETSELLEEDIDEENSEDLSDASVLRWEYLGGSDTQRKLVTSNDDTFAEDFILQYTDEIPEAKLIANMSRYYAVEYPLNENESVFVFFEDVEGGTSTLCVYYDKSQSEPYTDSELNLANYPDIKDENYTFTTEEFSDLSIVSYVYTGELNYSDEGNMYYDSMDHLTVWDYYRTSGCRQMYFVWDGDGIAMIIDTGGQAAGTLEDDEDILVGIYTIVYTFEEPVAFEDFSF